VHPMPPMVLSGDGLLERVGGNTPFAGGCLTRGARNPAIRVPTSFFELRSEVLPTTALRVRRLLHLVMELAQQRSVRHRAAATRSRIKSAMVWRRPSRSFASLTRSAGVVGSRARARDHAPTGTIARKLPSGMPATMSGAILPHRQTVRSAANSSVRRTVTSARISVVNGRASGSSVRGSKSTVTNRRARSLRNGQAVCRSG